jgi:hypothetical protein
MKVAIGKSIEMDVDITKLGLPPEGALSPVATHLVYLGLRNALMDSHAGVSDADKAREAAERKLARFYDGEVRATAVREADPVRAEAMRMATKAVEAAYVKKGVKRKDFDRKVITADARANVEKFMATANKNLKAAKAVNIEVEIAL